MSCDLKARTHGSFLPCCIDDAKAPLGDFLASAMPFVSEGKPHVASDPVSLNRLALPLPHLRLFGLAMMQGVDAVVHLAAQAGVRYSLENPGAYAQSNLVGFVNGLPLVLIELKRDRTPREVVAQALDYASWVAELTADRIVQIYSRFTQGGSLESDFQKRFGVELDEEILNQSHQIIIVASELDRLTGTGVSR